MTVQELIDRLRELSAHSDIEVLIPGEEYGTVVPTTDARFILHCGKLKIVIL